MKMQAAIREQLPEEISAMLRSRLEEAENALAENTNLKLEIEHLRERTETARTLNKREEMLDARDADLLLRGVELDTALRDAKLKEMEFELKAEQRVAGAMHQTLMGLVRNTEYRKVMEGTAPDPNSTYGSTVPIVESGKYTAE
jgi:hypothetical protein